LAGIRARLIHLEVSVPRGRTKLRLRLPVAVVDRDLRAPRWRSLEGVALCVERLGAGIRHRDLDLLPFDGAAATRFRAPRVAAVIAAVVDATAAAVYS